MGILVQVLLTAVAVWVSTALPGIDLGEGSTAWVHDNLMVGNGDKGVYLDVTFLCSWLSGEAQVSDDENVDVRWWPLSDLPPMADWLVARLEAALSDEVEARFVR